MSIKKIILWHGLHIAVEVEPGDIRFPDTHKILMKCSYGHIRKHLGQDGDALDCYLGSDLDSPHIFQLHQLTFNGEPDEDKYMIGFKDIESAKKLYLAHMPKELFGGIVPSSIEAIRSHRVNKEAVAIGAHQYVGLELLESDSKGRAVVVRSRIAQGYNEKVSANGYSYEDDPFIKVAREVNKLVDEGVPIVSRLGHPEKGQRAETLPAISTLSHYNQYKAVELDIFTGEVFCIDRFIYPGTDKSIEWSERAYLRDYLPRSFEAYSYCAKVIGEGGEAEVVCKTDKIFCIAWLDPEIDTPGMGVTARMVDLLEHSTLNNADNNSDKKKDNRLNIQTYSPCTCGCTASGQCTTNKEANSTTSNNPNNSTDFNSTDFNSTNSIDVEAGEPNTSSGGNDTEGAKKMDLTALAKSLYEEGAPIDSALRIIKTQSTIGATPEDIANAVMVFADMMAGTGGNEPEMPMPGEELKKNTPDLYEMAAKRYEALKKKGKKATTPTATSLPTDNPTATTPTSESITLTQRLEALEQRSTQPVAQPPSPFASERERQLWAQYCNEQENKTKHQQTKSKVLGWLTQDTFESHNLKNLKKYPVANLRSLGVEAEDLIVKESYTEKELKIWLNGRLETIAAGAPEETQESTPRFEFGEQNDLVNRLKELSEAADRAAEATMGGAERLEKRGKIKEKLTAKIKRIISRHDQQVGPVLVMANEALRSKQKGFNYELGNAALDVGLITNESSPYTNTASNIATQAFMSELIYKRTLEPADYLDIIAPLLRTELYDYKPGDPFGLQVGDEVKWSLHRGIDPDNLNKLNVHTPGKSAVTATRLDRKFDSVSLQELAVEYLYELMQVNSLRSTWNVDIVGAIGDHVADLMNRALSRFGMSKMDNSARQFRAVPAQENTITANLVIGKSIVVGGETVTYDDSISHIVRLKMGQTANGTSIVPWLIVDPEEDKYNKPRGGKQTDIKNIISFGLPGGEVPIFGDLIKGKIVDKYEGQGANCAVDLNNCLIVVKSSLALASDNLPQNLMYSYVKPLANNEGNLVTLDFAIPNGLSEPEHINNILNTISLIKARVGKERLVQDNLFFTSKLITDGLLVKAQRWTEYFRQIGSTLKPNFEDFNTIGTIGGGIDLWGTDGYLLGGDTVGILTRRGSTKVVFGEKVQASGMRWIEVSGAEGEATKSTTGQREMFRQTYAFAAPRTRDDDGLADNEYGVCFKIKGASSYIA